MGGSCTKKETISEEIVLEHVVSCDSNRSSLTVCSISSIETDQEQQEQPIRKPLTKSKFFQPKDSPRQEKETFDNNPIPKHLELTISDSQVMREGTRIHITPDQIDGKAHELDTSFIFGKDAANDYCFPSDEKMGIRQFKIKYRPNKNEYYIKDCYTGSGLFTQLTGRQVVTNNVFCFSNSQILATVGEDQVLKLNSLKGEYEGKFMEFSPLQTNYVRLGRSKSCDIIFNVESNTSRYQCTFLFENGCWYAYDGKPGSPSTNGVWVLANRYIVIRSGLTFKSGLSTFVAKVY